MQTVGLCTMSLWLVRKILDILPRIAEYLMSFSGGLASQLILIFICVKVVPIFAELFEKAVKAFIWFLHKFE